MEEDVNIHEKIKTLMHRNGMTQKALAELTGVSQAAVNGWLKNAVPRPDAMERLAAIFCISSDYLVTDLDLPEWLPPARAKASDLVSLEMAKQLGKHLSDAASSLNEAARVFKIMAAENADK